MAIAAAVGLSSFLSYQCAAAVKAVSSAVAVTIVAVTIAVAATTAVATTVAVAKLIICKKPLRKQRFSFCINFQIKSKLKTIRWRKFMQKLHFNSPYSAENFDIHNISDPFAETLRSKSEEHNQRFTKYENSQKSTKIQENES